MDRVLSFSDRKNKAQSLPKHSPDRNCIRSKDESVSLIASRSLDKTALCLHLVTFCIADVAFQFTATAGFAPTGCGERLTLDVPDRCANPPCCWIDWNNELDWMTSPIIEKKHRKPNDFPLFVQIVHLYKLHPCTTIISSLYFTHGSPVEQSSCRKGPIRQICTLNALLQLTGKVWDYAVFWLDALGLATFARVFAVFLAGSYLACDQSPSWCIMTYGAAAPVYGAIILLKSVPSFSPSCIPPNYVQILYTPFAELVLMRPLTV